MVKQTQHFGKELAAKWHTVVGMVGKRGHSPSMIHRPLRFTTGKARLLTVFRPERPELIISAFISASFDTKIFSASIPKSAVLQSSVSISSPGSRVTSFGSK